MVDEYLIKRYGVKLDDDDEEFDLSKRDKKPMIFKAPTLTGGSASSIKKPVLNQPKMADFKKLDYAQSKGLTAAQKPLVTPALKQDLNKSRSLYNDLASGANVKIELPKPGGGGEFDGKGAGRSFGPQAQTPAKAFAYGSERIAQGVLGTAQGFGDYINAQGNRLMSGVTSLGGIAPNKVSETFDLAAQKALERDFTRKYGESIERRYNPYDSQRMVGDFNQMAGAMIPALSAGPTGAQIVIGTSAAGNSAKKAFAEGANVRDALNYGTLSGLSEVATERLAGGIPGLPQGILTSRIGSPFIRKALDVAGEGLEESINTAVDPLLQRITYNPDAQNATLGELGQSALMGSAMSAFMQGTMSAADLVSRRMGEPILPSAKVKNIVDNAPNVVPETRSIENLDAAQKTNQKNRFMQQVNEVMHGINPTYPLTVGDTPDILKRFGASDRIMTMNPTTVRKIAYPDGYMGGKHNLGFYALEHLSDQLENPVAVLKSATQRDSLVVFTEFLDAQGNPVMVPIHLDKAGRIGISNEVASMYGRGNFNKFIEEQRKLGNILFEDEKRTLQQLPRAGLQLPGVEAASDPIYSISDSSRKSNSNLDISKTDVAPLPEVKKPTLPPNDPMLQSLNWEKPKVDDPALRLEGLKGKETDSALHIVPPGTMETSSAMKDAGRKFYQYTVSGQSPLERLNKLQAQTGTPIIDAATQIARQAGGTVDVIGEQSLVSRSGDVIGDSYIELMKKIPKGQSAAFNDYMQNKHNIARMNLEGIADARGKLKTLREFIVEHPEIGNMPDWQRRDILRKATGPDDYTRNLVEEYERLVSEYEYARTVKNKPVNGNSVLESREAIERYEKEHPEFKKISEKIESWWDAFQKEWLVGSGLVSEKQYQHMREMYPDYIPTFRKDKKIGGSGLSGRSVSTPGVIKAAKGGTSEIIPLEESFMTQIDRTVKAARRNELYSEILDVARKNPEEAAKLGIRISESSGGTLDLGSIDGFLDSVDTETFKQLSRDGYTLTLMENGKPVTLDISRDMWNGLQWLQNKGISDDATRAMVNGMRAMTAKTKSAITGVNALFAITNTLRDFQTYFINSISNNPLELGSNYLRGILDVMTNSDTYKQYQALGGSRTGFYGSQEGFARSVEKNLPFGQASKGQKVQRFLNSPFRALGAIGEFTEKIPRVAEYRNAIKKYGDTPQGRKAASLAAADVTVNFSRNAPITKIADAGTMYLNAQVQGLDKMARQLKNRPISTLSKAAVSVTLPTLLLLLVNRDNPHYKDLDNRTKDSYFVIPNLSDLDENGNARTFIRLPKSREYGALLGASFDRIAQYLETGDLEGSFRDFGNTVATDILPSKPWTDHFLAPITTNLPYNKDFAGRSIVPQAMVNSNVSPINQYDINTSGLAKGIANIGQRLPDWGALQYLDSPKQVDYLISSYGGYPGQVLQALTSPQNKGSTPLETIGNAVYRAAVQPFERRFTADPRYQSSVTDQFYAEYEAAQREAADRDAAENLPAGTRTPEDIAKSYYNKIASQISELRKAEKEVLAQDIPYKEKQAQTDALREQMNELARSAKEGAEKAKDEYIYVPEISHLSDSRQEQARALYNIGISYRQFNDIYNKYKQINDMYENYEGDDSRATMMATELSKYLDTLNLDPKKRAAVDDAFKFYNMNPADSKAYRFDMLSDDQKGKYAKYKEEKLDGTLWGGIRVSEQDFVKILEITRGYKKEEDKKKALEAAGYSAIEANQIYNQLLK